MMFDGGAPPAPASPPPPPAPGPPPPPTAIAAPASSGGRSALLSAIQGGARLRKAVTNDRSSAPVSGKVIGDVAPPAHINTSVRPPSPPVATPVAPPLANDDSKNSNRQSVDWYADLAADHSAVSREPSGLASTREEDEDEDTRHAGPVPSIQVEESDPLEDVDKATEYRVRSLYAYEGQRAEDLSFGENLILTAHPSKSGGDWWHGTIVRDGKSGFFPKTYVQIMDIVKAKALYAYTGASADELPFAEGDVLSIVDRSESDWWKAEQGGVVFIVPAAYLELVEDGAPPPSSSTSTPAAQEVLPDTPRPPSHQTGMEGGSMNIDSSAGSSALTLLSSSDQRSLSSIDNDSDMDASDTDYHSFSDSDTDEDTDHEQQQTEEERKLEREARAMERKMVMEAAGLIIKQDERRPPPRPVRRNRSLRAAATKPRRPPPVVPAPRRQTSTASLTADPNKSLPAVPDHDVADGESILRLDDAFDRYEAFKLQGSDSASNRLSMASFDSGNGPVPPSPASSLTPSKSFDRESANSEGRYSGFLGHLLGRSRTPGTDGERRVFPVISGPISGPIGGAGAGEESRTPVGRESDPSFGLSWSSIVDKSALEGLPERERKRQEAIFEFIATEAAYVRDLQLIVEVFYGNLLDKLEPKAITVIFANVEDILLTNTTFLSSLEERQRDCRLYIDRIGDLLDSNLQNMKIYREYCTNQGNAIKVLQSLRESQPDLALHLQHLRDEPAVRNLDLSSYLLVPMQRITRYPLLIKQILHYTEPDEDRQMTEHALQTAEKILGNINEAIRTQEGRERLKHLSQDLWIGHGRLDLTAPTRHLGERKLIKEGVLFKAKSNRKLHAVLCNDIFILTDEHAKSLYRVPIHLSEAQVKEGRDDLTFSVATAFPRGGDTIALRAPSARECHLWMAEIDIAGRKSREADRRAASRKSTRM
ncbi:hypothetical protein OF83DRAFT_1146615 [Amylostereum chailletii]|nr:hypothetical protein OF83DRAFT_1146615 [Amylostereum chailletii]